MFKEPLRESSQPVTLTCSKSKPVDRQKNYSQPLTFFRLQPLTEIWTGDEDVKLKRLIDEHGTCSWTKVGESFSERTGKQCRERWYNHLDPSVKKGDWTAEVRNYRWDVYPRDQLNLVFDQMTNRLTQLHFLLRRRTWFFPQCKEQLETNGRRWDRIYVHTSVK